MTTNKTSRDGSELCEGLGPLPDSDWTPGATLQFSADQMRAYAAQAVAAERERCAKLCEAQIDGYSDYENLTPDVPWEADSMGEIRMAKQCAAKIRA